MLAGSSSPWIFPLFSLYLTTVIVFSVSAVDFLYNSFNTSTSTSGDLILVSDAHIDPTYSVISLTNDTKQSSIGRAFYSSKLNISTFSTSFIFSVLPEIASSPGFGLAFVLTNTTSPPGANSGQYFGLFSNSTSQVPGPLIAVEFDTGQNPEFDDPDGNHVGIDLNNIQSVFTQPAGYYRDNNNELIPIDMRSGKNVRAWIDFDALNYQINVTIAPAEERRPLKPLISYSDRRITDYVSREMFVGFSASKVTWVEDQRVISWSLSNNGGRTRELNTSDLPLFLPSYSSSPESLSPGTVAGVTVGAVVLALIFSSVLFYYCYYRQQKQRRTIQGDDDEEDREMIKYWPRRVPYEDLWKATDGFSRSMLLGHGGFGKVYKGILRCNNKSNNGKEEEEVVAVKCVSHDSKQGLREFMAEISTVGRLQHKSLVQIRGWCRRNTDLMLVYDYMPNGSLSRWLFPPAGDRHKQLSWLERRRILLDVAEGLQYLHEGWEQVVLHRDVKSSNILLDAEMRGRLGDFGLAKLYERGDAINDRVGRTRVVGTFGYMAPELAHTAAPTVASDVYGFGVVVLEMTTGRRPIELAGNANEDDWLLVEWARKMYEEGRLAAAADRRMELSSASKVEELELVMKLGLACCHPCPERRPTLSEVVQILSGDRQTKL